MDWDEKQKKKKNPEQRGSAAEMKPELKDRGDKELDKTPAVDASSLKDERGGKALTGQDPRWKQNRVSRWIGIAAGALFQNPIS
ncbi:hypothetical protein N0V91_001334 [Didymella pomorum]|uniref:Uncharacterized protein n=1 Tax=Didymella pomorum TaxID=749634 RepID=A0A9W8ZL39_9PLEO|nr:hypothetical protein N0V91_001334 [Didymella pomorum]